MAHPLISKLQSIGELGDDDLLLLEEVGKDIRRFAARRDIIRDGDKPDHVHLMLDGWACRYKILREGQRQITAFLVPGDFCDVHITMLPRMDHGIGALTAASVAFLSRDLMRQLIDRPVIARALWWASLVDEGVLRAWIVNLGRRDAFERIANLICELHARLNNVGLMAAGAFELPLTQEELGDALGLTPVHVNRVLKRLHEQELMTMRRQRILIPDIDRLRSTAGFDPSYLHLAGPGSSRERAAGAGAPLPAMSATR